MKLLIATLSIVFTMLSCNVKDKKISLNSDVKTFNTDTISLSKEPSLTITKALVLGKFNYKTDTTFVQVSTKYSAKSLYLNKTVYAAFIEMRKAAENDGVILTILSGTRNFAEQKAIWERKWNKYSDLKPLKRAQKILEYSSMPSSSRHHWGTDMDLNSLSNSYFSSGNGKNIYNWLNENANSFGFYQVYTEKNKLRTGYNLEKWHWSYLPLANPYLEFYNSNITVNDINAFKGAELAKDLNIINDYVNGISQKAKMFQ